MKKLAFTIVILFAFNCFAQSGAAAIKLGAFTPGATNTGFIIGYEGGKYIDQNFNFGWSIDWFHKNYIDKKLVDEFNEIPGVSVQENELKANTNIHDLPLMANVTVKFRLAPRAKFYITGGVGAEVLFVDYKNYNNPDKGEFKVAFDFDWRVGLGTAYNIGPLSELLLEMAYHRAQPSWTYDVDIPNVGKRTFERVYDMSGLMFRVGFRFYY
ncbi:outer membrane beta-barrel protein [bacterium BMS3Abin03]|nr:outer membrane beta-barrel protein [bacterium BMS3Abin03]MCG6958420.1 outer membrane beta-barrel protein [bacterium BMS3Abin03]